MKRVIVAPVLVLLVAAGASAQDSLQAVRDLYASAAYEDALTAIKRLPSDPPLLEVAQYRVFCLIALERHDEAREAITDLISAAPLYVPDPAEVSPRVREVFHETRQQLLSELTKQIYLDARAALDRKDRDAAIAGFEEVLKIVETAGASAGTVAEFRVLAEGFLDLSRALAEPEALEPDPPALAEAPIVAGPIAETGPVAVRQQLPPWVPSDAVSRRAEYSGAVRLRIAADGRVESATMLRAVHPSYDGPLLRAARGWIYAPATQDGVPVASELVVEVNLRPPQ